MSQVAISVSEVTRYVPHRPPMVWVDEVVAYSAEAGECLVKIKNEAHYMDAKALRPSSCLEFIAQSYGFIWTCYVTRVLNPKAKAMERAFLVSFKNVKFAEGKALASVKGGDVLKIKISGIRPVGPITAFRGQVFKDSTLLCEAQMRTFSE